MGISGADEIWFKQRGWFKAVICRLALFDRVPTGEFSTQLVRRGEVMIRLKRAAMASLMPSVGLTSK